MTTTFDHLTIGSVLDYRAATEPDRQFLTYHDPREPAATHTLTYGSCAAEVTALQAVLRERARSLATDRTSA